MYLIVGVSAKRALNSEIRLAMDYCCDVDEAGVSGGMSRLE